jgi:Zn-dependent protease
MLNPDDERFLAGVGTRLPGQRAQRRPWAGLEILGSINWPLWLGFLAVMAAALYLCRYPNLVTVGVVGFVLVGWIFSLTLHEFGHAATAFASGDRSLPTRRYLSGNPLLYIHPYLSIVFPLLFLIIGGIPLPGGAVYLNRAMVRGRGRQAAISLAGPAANLVVGALLLALVRVGDAFGLFGPAEAALAAESAVVFVAALQFVAVILNLLPIPGLDGGNAILPFLGARDLRTFFAIQPYAFVILFAIIWLVPGVNDFIWSLVYRVLALGGVDPALAYFGQTLFMFWRR